MHVHTSRRRPSRGFLESLPVLSDNEQGFMYEAILEARKHPYPCVGALLVADGEIIARGHRHKEETRICRSVHAEQAALEVAPKGLRGVSLYTTLEPCTYRMSKAAMKKKCPPKPCCDLILEYGLRRVVVGGIDGNEYIAGRGLLYLREKRISIVYGGRGLEKELQKLFPSFRRP